MRERAEEALAELHDCPNGIFKLVKGLRVKSKDVEGGRCMKGSDEKLCEKKSEMEIGSLEGLCGTDHE